MTEEEKKRFDKEFPRRLKEVRRALGLSQEAFAREMGVSKPTYVRYETGGISAKVGLCFGLHKRFDVNLHWLMTGEGGMFVNKDFIEIMNKLQIDESVISMEQFLELMLLLKIPEIKWVLLAKLTEIRFILKERVDEVVKQAGITLKDRRPPTAGTDGEKKGGAEKTRTAGGGI